MPRAFRCRMVDRSTLSCNFVRYEGAGRSIWYFHVLVVDVLRPELQIYLI